MRKRLFGAVLVVALVVSCFTLFAFNAQAATNMKASDACVDVIKEIEGFFAIPYWDYSQWTVGFGTTCPADRLDEYLETGIPVEDAEALLREQLAKFEKTVNDFAKKNGLNLTQGQFDALVSFTYNLGSSMLTRSDSTLANAILSGAKGNDLIFAFSVYCMAGGDFMSGLMRRRLAEADMFINGHYDDYAPDSYCYVLYNANGGTRDVSAQGYDANMPAAPMSRPSKSGYEFVGWFTKAEGGVKITSLDETTHGLTLYAHWQKSETEAEDPVDPTGGINVIVMSAAVNLRCGPSIGYGIISRAYAGDRLTILGTTLSNGMIWGQTKDGWIALVHTNYNEIVASEPEENDGQKPTLKVPVLATVVNADGIKVYNGPHTTYPQLKTLKLNTQIMLLETIVFAGKEWARYEGGWVQLDAKLVIHDENKLVHNFTAVTSQALTVRSGPGTSYSQVTTLAKNTSHTVYSIVMVNGAPWGRVAKGWVNLNYTNYDASKLSQYQNHIYGSWYIAKEAECGSDGLEQRDCKYCDHSETRVVAGTKHVWGNWTTLQEATCTQTGKEQRTCQKCGSKETNVIPARGHSFGEWYETKAPTTETAGEERRDCQACGHFETRRIPKVGMTLKIYATITYDYLSIREGAGTNYTRLGYYYKGDVVEILEQVQVGSNTWGRTDKGWICLTGYTSLEEVEESETHTHSYGDWYVTKAATTTEKGQERRDCACGHYETREIPMLEAENKLYGTLTGYDYLTIRSGPGTSYTAVGKLYRGDRVEILEIKTVGTTQWGRIQQGWICITGYITLEEDSHTHSYGDWYVTKAATTTEKGQERRDCACGHYETREIPMLEAENKLYGTLTGYDYLTIRSGPGTSYTAVGKLYRGDRVEILEIKTVGTTQWGRIQQGWICITGYITLEGVTRTYATITCSSLSIREGAGTGYTRLGYYYQGETVEILEQVQVGSNTWGRTEKGWICLTGYTTLKTITE